MKMRLLVTETLIGVTLLCGCGTDWTDLLAGSSKSPPPFASPARNHLVPDSPTPTPPPSPCPSYQPGMNPSDYGDCYNGPGMPLGLGIPSTPLPTPTPRDPLPLRITKEEAIQSATTSHNSLPANTMELVVQCTWAEAPKYLAWGCGPSYNRFGFDPVWVVRFHGTFSWGTGYFAIIVDGNTGAPACDTYSSEDYVTRSATATR